MIRRSRITVLALVLAAVVVACAARPATAERIVIVLSAEAAPYREAEKAIKAELAPRHAEVRTALLTDVNGAKDTAETGKSDAVIAVGTDAAVYLHTHLAQSVALVYCMVSDPAVAGLTSGRVTHGVRVDVPYADQAAVIARALPQCRTVGVLYRSDQAASKDRMEKMKESLPAGWRLEAVAVDKHESASAAIDAVLTAGVDVVWTAADPAVYDTACTRTLLLAALRKKTAVFGFSAPCVRAGACLGVGVGTDAQGRAAARILTEALAHPTSEAIHKDPEFALLINRAAAEQLGVKFAPEFMREAVDVSKIN